VQFFRTEVSQENEFVVFKVLMSFKLLPFLSRNFLFLTDNNTMRICNSPGTSSFSQDHVTDTAV